MHSTLYTLHSSTPSFSAYEGGRIMSSGMHSTHETCGFWFVAALWYLRGREDQVEPLKGIDQAAQPALETQLRRVAHAALLHVEAEHVVAVALLVPAHPVDVAPLGQRL